MRLIDADYLLDQIDDAETVTKDGIAYCVDCSVEEDAVIVVRCKDCKHKYGCSRGMIRQKDDWFCADGERRTE